MVQFLAGCPGDVWGALWYQPQSSDLPFQLLSGLYICSCSGRLATYILKIPLKRLKPLLNMSSALYVSHVTDWCYRTLKAD